MKPHSTIVHSIFNTAHTKLHIKKKYRFFLTNNIFTNKFVQTKLR